MATRVSTLTAADPSSTDVFAVEDGTDAKKLTLSNLETHLLGSNRVIDLSAISTYPSGATTLVTGDGSTDDTAALQAVFDNATAATDVVYVPGGYQIRVTDTINPTGVSIVGETRDGHLDTVSGSPHADPRSLIIADITKSSTTTGVCTDVYMNTANILSTSTDFTTYGFAVEDVILVEHYNGATRLVNDYLVATISSISANTLGIRESNGIAYVVEWKSFSSGDETIITKLIPVIEDGSNINGRTSGSGGSIVGIGVQGTVTSQTDYPTSLSSTAYVIGYKSGYWDGGTDEVIVRAQIDMTFANLAAGAIMGGWQNHIKIHADYCPLGFQGQALNACDVWIDCDSCGTIRMEACDASRIYVHNQGNDTWVNYPVLLRTMSACDIQVRLEGGNSASNDLTRRLTCDYMMGSTLLIYLYGAKNNTTPPITINNSTNSVFTGRVYDHAGSAAEIDFNSGNTNNVELFRRSTGFTITGSGYHTLGTWIETDSSRSAATAVPVGTMIFNTDDGAPNWSDGTNWVDATGTTT